MTFDQEVLRLIDAGLTNAAIAETLGRGKRGVERARARLRERGLLSSSVVVGHIGEKVAEIEPEVSIEDPNVASVKDMGSVVELYTPFVKTIDDALAAHDVDLSHYAVRSAVAKSWQAMVKNNDGRPEVVQLHGVTVTLERNYGPVTRAVEVPYTLAQMPREVPLPGELGCCLVVPDSQHGFRWNENYTKLLPMHDRVALDAILQLAGQLQPDTIIFLGDMLDMTTWTNKYRREPDCIGTTDPSIWELHWQLAQFRLACPSAKLVYLEGNHEYRIQSYLMDTAPEVLSTRAVGTKGPLLSVPNLLNLKSLDIEYVAPYGEVYWLYDAVAVTHGDLVRNGGGNTAVATLNRSVVSAIYGHIHKLERVSRTLLTPEGRVVITAMSPGCTCRLDAPIVPATSRHTDWQQGCGVVWARYDGDAPVISMDVVEITDGTLIYGGDVYRGRDMSRDIADFAGYPQIAT